jgi:PRTRC genetic system ThiF family protein
VQLGSPNYFPIILVGCGGTGSFLALHLARLAYHARQAHGLDVRLRFIDPDVVEEKNIGRQNFCPAEVGLNKATALATRYSHAFGLSIEYVTTPVSKDDVARSSALLVGAVDNARARKTINRMATQSAGRLWWLDCGNHEHAGQVLLGNRPNLQAPEISPMGFCSGLPLPSIQHPELLTKAKTTSTRSCADLALADAQSLMINQAMATYAAQYIYRLVLTHDLDVYATYIDLVTGSARSLPITEAENGKN